MTDDFAPKSRRNHFATKLYLIFTGITLTQLLKTLSKIRPLLLKGARKIAPEEICPSVRIRVWFRISVTIRAGGNFARVQFSWNPFKTVKSNHRIIIRSYYSSMIKLRININEFIKFLNFCSTFIQGCLFLFY